MDSEVRDFYSEEENIIDMKRSMEMPLEGYDISVWDYLNPTRGNTAFTFFKGWNKTGFDVSVITDIAWFNFNPKEAKAFSLPQYLIPEKGDLFIGYAEPVKLETIGDERITPPYMFFLQHDDFDKLSATWASSHKAIEFIKGGLLRVFSPGDEMKVCSSIETVPS
jgi:hypothetical protein